MTDILISLFSGTITKYFSKLTKWLYGIVYLNYHVKFRIECKDDILLLYNIGGCKASNVKISSDDYWCLAHNFYKIIEPNMPPVKIYPTKILDENKIPKASNPQLIWAKAIYAGSSPNSHT